MVVETDDPDRFTPGARFWTDEPRPRRLTVESARPFRDRGMIVAFAGVTDRVAAEDLRGVVLTISGEERRRLAPDEYWPEDLVGMEVVGPGGEPLGEVTEVAFGPQDRLVVRTPGGRRVEVPFVRAIVGDRKDGYLPIDPPAGLFEDAG